MVASLDRGGVDSGPRFGLRVALMGDAGRCVGLRVLEGKAKDG